MAINAAKTIRRTSTSLRAFWSRHRVTIWPYSLPLTEPAALECEHPAILHTLARHHCLSFALGDVRLRCFASIPLITKQLVRDVVLVDVTDVGDRLAADPLRGDALDVAEPHVGIEASLFRLGPELSDPSRPGVVGRKGHQTFV